MTPQVTVYWRPMCGYCTTLKRELDHRGVVFESVDVSEHRDLAEVVREANGGDELVPTVRIDNTYLANPSVEDVLAELRS